MDENKSLKHLVFSNDSLSKYRIEALTDGVFAIVMTLMILSLKLPEDIPGHLFATDIKNHLLLLLPKLENYAISFIVLGVYWIRHQSQFNIINYANRILLWINIVFLMFVALIPFTTSFMMHYPNVQLPLILYGSNLSLIGLLLYLHWKYATSNFRLIDKDVSIEYINKSSRLTLAAPIIFLFSIAVSFFSIRLSITMMYLVPIVYIVYRNYVKVIKPKVKSKRSVKHEKTQE
jgi:uncharacterized membrane protein